MIDPQTRIAKARAEIVNNNGLLKPEMFVTGILSTSTSGEPNQLVVPQSAVLWTGTQSIVYVKKPNFDQPTFEYRQITIGPTQGNYYLVVAGLSAGEEVVTNGAFTIDAAAQLSGKISMMNPPAGTESDPGQAIDIPSMKEPQINADTNKETAQQKTETSFWVGGACGMCKNRLEDGLAKVPGVISADWNVGTKLISLQYDNNRINEVDIHKTIAGMGHDTEKIKAEDSVYDNLMDCCKYDRNSK